MTEQVSVIIPVFNAEFFIENAVHSVLKHDCVGEVILVEDGSTDSTSKKCCELALRYSKVKCKMHPNHENRGAAASRNLGIQLANFPIISFLDADDIYYENRFKEALLLLRENPSIQACYGIVEVINLDTGRKKNMGFLKKSPSTSVLTYLLKGGYFHTNSITVRKSFFKEVGFFDQVCWPHEDSELWIRMASKGKVSPIVDKAPIASYSIHNNNLSKVASIKSKKIMWNEVYNKVYGLPIGVFNKILILKQLFKFWLRAISN
ncbi:MAG: glycosyltransferase family 2 protein [Algoriphagus sp.]|uniref:glycosyltransferase family 2 protein n=1 Tax=Algoriphagus sp. TaxID=1872435 RepID=UPI0017C4E3C7|nr:glycosyltransferase family A protein [Algoriphagus sp.]NVJ86804.1 glycosyltransferase family 2 protein [Algoriphagus sp.]